MGFASIFICCYEQLLNTSYEQGNILTINTIKNKLLITANNNVDEEIIISHKLGNLADTVLQN